MTDDRRNFIAGGSFFFTTNLAEWHAIRRKAMGFAKGSTHPGSDEPQGVP